MKKLFLIFSLSFLFATIAITEDFKFLEDGFTMQNVATLAGPTGNPFSFCWVIKPCADCIAPYNIQYRKYRAEGSQEYMSPLIHVSEWKLNSTLPDGSKEYCVRDSVPMSGHWIYEARLCGPDGVGGAVCKIGQSIDPNFAVVDINSVRSAQPWWVYTFLSAPGTPEINMKWFNTPSVEKLNKEVITDVVYR